MRLTSDTWGRVSGMGAELSIFFLLPILFMTMKVKDKAASLKLLGVPLQASLPRAGTVAKPSHSLKSPRPGPCERSIKLVSGGLGCWDLVKREVGPVGEGCVIWMSRNHCCSLCSMKVSFASVQKILRYGEGRASGPSIT